MAISPAAVAAIVAQEVDEIFRDAGNVIKDGEANYLRDGNPQSVSGRISQAAGRSACRIYGTGTVDLNPGAAARYERACRPYLDSINPGGGSSIGIPFEGGQCGIPYRINGKVTYAVTRCDNGAFFPGQEGIIVSEYQFIGPVISVAARVFGNGPCGPDGITVDVISGTPPTTSNVGFIFNPIGTLSGATWSGTVEAQPGAVDNCGNPPPVIGQPRPDTDPTPPPFRFNPAPDIDIDLDVDLKPDGEIDIDIGTGPISINPTVNIGGGGGGGGGGGAAPPGDVGEPGDAGETGEGGDTDGEAPEGSVLVGLKIDFVSPPVGGNEYKAGIFRGVCYVYMGTSEGVDHDPAGAMLRDGQFIFAEKDNLTTWFVSANQGYNLRVTPYYRPVEGED